MLESAVGILDSTSTGVLEDVSMPGNFFLYQNYPNPFNTSTIISYQLQVSSNLLLEIYDVLGNKIVTLVNEEKQPGTYKINFDGSNLSSGIYFYTLTAGDFKSTKKLMLLK